MLLDPSIVSQAHQACQGRLGESSSLGAGALSTGWCPQELAPGSFHGQPPISPPHLQELH